MGMCFRLRSKCFCDIEFAAMFACIYIIIDHPELCHVYLLLTPLTVFTFNYNLKPQFKHTKKLIKKLAGTKTITNSEIKIIKCHKEQFRLRFAKLFCCKQENGLSF